MGPSPFQPDSPELDMNNLYTWCPDSWELENKKLEATLSGYGCADEHVGLECETLRNLFML